MTCNDLFWLATLPVGAVALFLMFVGLGEVLDWARKERK